MKKAVIIGAGPAGLTAAYELLTHTDIIPVVIEADNQVGGLSKTIDYKGNKIDIGGHRFFSKSDRVLDWWLQFLPLEENADNQLQIGYHNRSKIFKNTKTNAEGSDKVMLLRPRKSRIYYNRKFFDYPLRLSGQTVRNLGAWKMFLIGISYLKAKIFPEANEVNLAQFYRNRFGNELYKTFFRDYTEKVWGVSCEKIPSSWGKQRVKDLNISKVLTHAFKTLFTRNETIQQKETSTSLIEQFLYPKYGPGQLWETVAEEIIKRGGTIHLNSSVEKIYADNDSGLIKSITAANQNSGEKFSIDADYFFSSMPVKQLLQNLEGIEIPKQTREIAGSLEYRDFLIVGILASKLEVTENDAGEELIRDNWIYIQDSHIKAGRIQVFNNWSPFMVKNAGDTWLGVEYFCNESDAFWKMDDESIIQIAISEMQSIGILHSQQVKDAMVARVKKAYPSYYGSYNRFSEVQAFTDKIENLFLIGRNGMHRYNNSDHSMLTAMTAVDNIITGRKDKTNIWEVNTEEDYHEEIEE